MKKSWIIVLISIVLLMLGILLGIYDYEKARAKDSNMPQNTQLAEKREYINEEEKQNLIETLSTEEKVSPNCSIVQKEYFKGCDHLIRTVKEIPEECINYTKEQIEKRYKEWKIEEFSSNQIIIYQEEEGFCGQHYKIKEYGQVIGIYSVDEKGVETLKQETEIQTMYLPEEDLKKLRQGIEVIGDTQLYSTIEDFE